MRLFKKGLPTRTQLDVNRQFYNQNPTVDEVIGFLRATTRPQDVDMAVAEDRRSQAELKRQHASKAREGTPPGFQPGAAQKKAKNKQGKKRIVTVDPPPTSKRARYEADRESNSCFKCHNTHSPIALRVVKLKQCHTHTVPEPFWALALALASLAPHRPHCRYHCRRTQQHLPS